VCWLPPQDRKGKSDAQVGHGIVILCVGDVCRQAGRSEKDYPTRAEAKPES